MGAQKRVQPCFGNAEAVKRGRVKGAAADVPSRIQRGTGGFFADRRKQIAQRRGAEAHRGERQLLATAGCKSTGVKHSPVS